MNYSIFLSDVLANVPDHLQKLEVCIECQQSDCNEMEQKRIDKGCHIHHDGNYGWLLRTTSRSATSSSTKALLLIDTFRVPSTLEAER